MRKLALIAAIAFAAVLPLAAEGALGLAVNNGSRLFPAEFASLQNELYGQADYAFYLGAFILQPTVDIGVCDSGFTEALGLGLGYRIVDSGKFSLEATATPFAGVAGLQTVRPVWGARAMLRARLRLLGRFGIIGQVGAEWRNLSGIVSVPVIGLGFTL